MTQCVYCGAPAARITVVTVENKVEPARYHCRCMVCGKMFWHWYGKGTSIRVNPDIEERAAKLKDELGDIADAVQGLEASADDMDEEDIKREIRDVENLIDNLEASADELETVIDDEKKAIKEDRARVVPFCPTCGDVKRQRQILANAKNGDRYRCERCSTIYDVAHSVEEWARGLIMPDGNPYVPTSNDWLATFLADTEQHLARSHARALIRDGIFEEQTEQGNNT